MLEKGAVGNSLSRVYAITVEDGHSFCRVDQVKDEVINMCNLIKDFYSRMGLWEEHWVSLSVRDYEHPEKYIGEKCDWDLCEKMLEEISNELLLVAACAVYYGQKTSTLLKSFEKYFEILPKEWFTQIVDYLKKLDNQMTIIEVLSV